MAKGNQGLSEYQLNFIRDNRDRMRQVDIARALKITPACVNQRLKNGKYGLIVKEGIFNLNEFAKHYRY